MSTTIFAPTARKMQRDLPVATEVSPGINKMPGVCGGDACVRFMRIPVWLLVEARREGADEANLKEAYPQLTSQDFANAWEYARTHSEEIEAQIAENSMENIERMMAEDAE